MMIENKTVLKHSFNKYLIEIDQLMWGKYFKCKEEKP